jgi:hypothetical protein
MEGGIKTLNSFNEKKLINRGFVIISKLVSKNNSYSAKKFLSLFYGSNIFRYKENINLADNQLIKK